MYLARVAVDSSSAINYAKDLNTEEISRSPSLRRVQTEFITHDEVGMCEERFTIFCVTRIRKA